MSKSDWTFAAMCFPFGGEPRLAFAWGKIIARCLGLRTWWQRDIDDMKRLRAKSSR